MVGIGWGRLGKETHGRTIQKQTNKEHGRLWNSALKASGTAVIIAIKKKKAGSRDRKELTLGHTAGTDSWDRSSAL